MANVGTDALTDLPGRISFNDRLQAACNQAKRYRRICALLLVDLDRFKEVNDRLGHAAGDQLLIEAGRRLVGCVREADTVARLGGDEFALVLSEVAVDREAELVAARAVRLLSEPYYLDAGVVQLSGSLGIALYPLHGNEIEQVQRNAGSALRAAKEAGGNTYLMHVASRGGDRPQGDLL